MLPAGLCPKPRLIFENEINRPRKKAILMEMNTLIAQLSVRSVMTQDLAPDQRPLPHITQVGGIECSVAFSKDAEEMAQLYGFRTLDELREITMPFIQYLALSQIQLLKIQDIPAYTQEYNAGFFIGLLTYNSFNS